MGWGKWLELGSDSQLSVKGVGPVRSVLSLWRKICRAGAIRELEPRHETQRGCGRSTGLKAKCKNFPPGTATSSLCGLEQAT